MIITAHKIIIFGYYLLMLSDEVDDYDDVSSCDDKSLLSLSICFVVNSINSVSLPKNYAKNSVK